MSYLANKICLKLKLTKTALNRTSLIIFRSLKMAENTSKALREKPIVVICGCTGTGKTKLSVELAKRFPKKAEIINADAMQLYEGLDVITNKATKEEMAGVPHHLIGYLDPMCLNYKIMEYKKDAIDLIDKLLESDKLPIVIGGTNYYIESLIWDITIDDPKDNNENEKKRKIDDLFMQENGIEDAKFFSNSSLTNEKLYEQLMKVDEESAKRIHPNDRRKICRALEIYYQHGISKSELLQIKNNQEGSSNFHGPLRYKKACIFMMNCQTEILDKRLDDRVDDMMKKGLLDELIQFYSQLDAKLDGKNLDEYSQQFQIGIFQSIGFKEFYEYLKLDVADRNSDEGKELFEKAVNEMKATTRKYAKKQLRWIRSRFVKRSNEFTPDVYELDATDLDRWNENVLEKANEILQCRIEGKECVHRPMQKLMKDEAIFEHNFCEPCNRTFINISQWNDHLKSRLHKKRIQPQKFPTEKRKKPNKQESEPNETVEKSEKETSE